METIISLKDYQQAYGKLVRKEEKREFLIHLITFILMNAILIAINLIYTPGFKWFYWVLIGWGMGLVFHYLFGVRSIMEELLKKEALAEKQVRDKNACS